MMLLYENGFSDFSSNGICYIHKELFGDVYEWAGQYRKINIQKREKILAGKSVWYSNNEDIEKDFREACGKRIEKMIDVEYVFQEKDDLPNGYKLPETISIGETVVIEDKNFILSDYEIAKVKKKTNTTHFYV